MPTIDKTAKKTSNAVMRKEKLINRFLYDSEDILSEKELAEMLLLIGFPKDNLDECVNRLFIKFGNLNNILTASLDELCSVEGVTENMATAFKVITSCTNRAAKETIKTKKISIIENWDLFLDYCRQDLAYNDIEVFKMFLLDEKMRCFDVKTISKGTINRTVAHPREVIKTAFNNKAKSLILAHNHPSGDYNPSPEDITLTYDLFCAAQDAGINIFDHLIITKNKIFSFRNSAYLERFLHNYNNM